MKYMRIRRTDTNDLRDLWSIRFSDSPLIIMFWFSPTTQPCQSYAFLFSKNT